MDREAKFNILRGIVISSFLDNEQKSELIEFLEELESKTDLLTCENHGDFTN